MKTVLRGSGASPRLRENLHALRASFRRHDAEGRRLLRISGRGMNESVTDARSSTRQTEEENACSPSNSHGLSRTETVRYGSSARKEPGRIGRAQGEGMLACERDRSPCTYQMRSLREGTGGAAVLQGPLRMGPQNRMARLEELGFSARQCLPASGPRNPRAKPTSLGTECLLHVCLLCVAVAVCESPRC